MAAIHTANKLAEIRAEGSSGGEKGEGDAGGSKNPIMRINEIAMTHGLCVEWEMVSEQVCDLARVANDHDRNQIFGLDWRQQ